jgi:XTP/dITP diphosphohydrolase
MSDDKRIKIDGISRLVLATGNARKLAELQALLRGFDTEIVGLTAFPGIPRVDETGSTFAENAELKAAQYAIAANTFAIADDSGLEVNELDGRPGIHSARFGGPGLSDRERTAKLLEEMRCIPSGRRNARFTAAISLAAPDGKIAGTFYGYCYGSIALEPRGHNGFGYDPVFIPENSRRTFAELPDEAKAELSHRSRAMAKLIEFLPHFTGV